MADVAAIRQQVQQARAHMEKGEWAKAQAILKQVDHPKAQSLLAQVEAKLAEQRASVPVSTFPLIPVLGLVGLVLILAIGAFVFLQPRDIEPIPVLELLPTLVPTDDCTPESVQVWWTTNLPALNEFNATQRLASHSNRGERLDETLLQLRQLRADFLFPPACASADVLLAVDNTVQIMDANMTTLQNYATHGDVAFYPTELEATFRQATEQIRQAVYPSF